MDSDTIIAALLHDSLEDTQATFSQIEERFGAPVAQMVEGVTKIADISAKNKTIQEAENIRKMLFAMVKDIRVILIKLADKLHNMRTLEYLPSDRRKIIAQDCIDIYAPLADRLGISWLKDELEDYSLKHLNREVYDQIKKIVSLKRGERAQFLLKVQEAIERGSRGVRAFGSPLRDPGKTFLFKFTKKCENGIREWMNFLIFWDSYPLRYDGSLLYPLRYRASAMEAHRRPF